MSQLVGQSTALAHGVPSARDANKDSSPSWVPHCQAMLVWAYVEDRHIDAGCLFDDLLQVT
jgi:hypothetical protein